MAQGQQVGEVGASLGSGWEVGASLGSSMVRELRSIGRMLPEWIAQDRLRTKAISLFLQDHREKYMANLPSFIAGPQAEQKRRALLGMARKDFRSQDDLVQREYDQKAAEFFKQKGQQVGEVERSLKAQKRKRGQTLGRSGSSGRHRLRGKQSGSSCRSRLCGKQPGPAGRSSSEAPQTPHRQVRKSSPEPPQTPLRQVRKSPVGEVHSPEQVPTRINMQQSEGVGMSGSDCAGVKLSKEASTQTEPVLTPALRGGACNLPWGRQFSVQGCDPQARLHSRMVDQIQYLRHLYGDSAAAEVFGASLRLLDGCSSELGVVGVPIEVKVAALLGLAVKLTLDAELMDKAPVKTLWARVAGSHASTLARVEAFELRLVNRWPEVDAARTEPRHRRLGLL